MKTIKEIILQTDFESIEKEIIVHYDAKHMQHYKLVYTKLRNMKSKSNIDNMKIFIRALKENEQGDEDIVIQEFDNEDNTIMFDVCGEDNKYDGLYSIASSDYDELLGYYVEQSTIEKFSSAQIIAHLLCEIEWCKDK